MTPGTVCKINDRSPWPERRGLTAVVVDTRGAEHEYPVHGLGRDEVIVLINADPLSPPLVNADPFSPPWQKQLPNGHQWSCCINKRSLDVIEEPAL